MSLLAEALKLADFGFYILPVRSNKMPLLQHWSKKASKEPHLIKAWWNRWPNAQIGICTTKFRDNQALLVVDIDVKKADGFSSFTTLNEYAAYPPTLAQRTGSGGLHLIYIVSKAVKHGKAGRLAPGIDLRSRGGYIVAAPSCIHNKPYLWLSEQDLNNLLWPSNHSLA